MNPSVNVRNCLLVVLSIFLLSGVSVFGGARIFQLDPNDALSATHGVEEIILEEIDGFLHMTVLNGRSSVIARAVVSRSEDQSGNGVITIRKGVSWLELEWNPVNGYIAVTDLATGESGLIEHRPLAMDWQRDETAEAILSAQYETAEFAAALFVYAEDEWYHTHMSPGGGGGEMMGGEGTLLCITGRYHRGTGYDTTRSYCCMKAACDVAMKCTNPWCFGCCHYWPCDACCAVGDYFCFCGMTGRACSEEDYPD